MKTRLHCRHRIVHRGLASPRRRSTRHLRMHCLHAERWSHRERSRDAIPRYVPRSYESQAKRAKLHLDGHLEPSPSHAAPPYELSPSAPLPATAAHFQAECATWHRPERAVRRSLFLPPSANIHQGSALSSPTFSARRRCYAIS